MGAEIITTGNELKKWVCIGSEVKFWWMVEKFTIWRDQENRRSHLSSLFGSKYTSLKVIVVGNKEYTPEEFIDYYFE